MKLLLLLYVSRSGSTLFASEVARHFSQVLVIPELRLPGLLVKRDVAGTACPRQVLLDLVAGDHQFSVLNLSSAEVEQCIDRMGESYSAEGFLREIARAVAAKNDLQPEVVMFKCGAAARPPLFLLRQRLPEIGLVHIYRDPRAAVNSAMRTERPYHPGETMGRGDPWLQAERWNTYCEKMQQLEEADELLLQVRYEELCADPDRILRQFADVLDLGDYTYGGAGFAVAAREQGIHANVQKAASTERSAAWKSEMPAWQGLAVEQVTREQRRRLQYPDYFGKRGLGLSRRLGLAYAKFRHRRDLERRREKLHDEKYGDELMLATDADEIGAGGTTADDMHVLFISNRDPRKRYRFQLEPLREVGASVELLDGAGAASRAVPKVIARLLRKPRVDVVMLTGGNSSNLIWYLLTTIFSRARVVLRFGGHPLDVRASVMRSFREQKQKLSMYSSFRNTVARARTRFMLRHVAAVIAVSEYLLLDMRSVLGSKVKTLVLPPVIEAPEAANEARSSAPPGSPVRVLTVTNLKYREKADGVIAIAAAVERIASALAPGIEIQYDVLGGGNELNYLQQNLEQRGLLQSGRVRLHGRLDNVADFYRGADIFAYSSTLDGYPLVLCEAQSFGLPVVANRWGAFPDMMNDGSDALFFEQDDNGDGLAAALEKLVADQPLREQMSRAARENFIARHSLAKSGERLQTFLQSLTRHG